MARRQQTELDFSNEWRFAAHLERCGVAPVAAGLAGLVLEKGAEREVGGESVMVLSISSRQAATYLKCSDRAVAKAAATLVRWGWFRVLAVGRRQPPLYVLDVVAARSMPTPDERLDELLQPPPPQEVRTRCEPGANQVRTRCEPVRTAPRVLTTDQNQNPCLSSIPSPISDTGRKTECAVVRSGAQQFAAVRSPAERWPYPWSAASGVGDGELVAAVRDEELAVLRWLYDVATSDKLRWIVPSDDAWLRFLTAAHHAATARLARRMGRLVAFVKSGLDVGRCGQASDRFAGRLAASAWRDPALARRLVAAGDDGQEPFSSEVNDV